LTGLAFTFAKLDVLLVLVVEMTEPGPLLRCGATELVVERAALTPPRLEVPP
jgi:hypothetical protein